MENHILTRAKHLCIFLWELVFLHADHPNYSCHFFAYSNLFRNFAPASYTPRLLRDRDGVAKRREHYILESVC